MRGYLIKRYLVRLRRIWRDLLFRAVVFLGLSVLAFGFMWHDAAYNQKQKSEIQPDNYGNQSEQAIASYTFWLDIGTFLLVASTVALWIVTWRSFAKQNRDTRRSLAIARIAADAAKQSAQVASSALTDAERPYVFVFGVLKLRYSNERVHGRSAFVEYIVANYGRTPAVIEEARAEFLLSETKDSGVPAFVDENASISVQPIIAPGEKRKPITVYISNISNAQDPDSFYPEVQFDVAEDDDGVICATPTLTKEQRLFFRVIIKYRGPFTAGHETSACWKYLKGFDYFDLDGPKTNYER